MNKAKKLKRSHKRRVATIKERYSKETRSEWARMGAKALWKKIRSGVPV